MPGWILAPLNTDVDEHEGLAQNAGVHDPGGEFGIGIGEQIHTLLLPYAACPRRKPISDFTCRSPKLHPGSAPKGAPSSAAATPTVSLSARAVSCRRNRRAGIRARRCHS